jgi:hypothetical protein
LQYHHLQAYEKPLSTLRRIKQVLGVRVPPSNARSLLNLAVKSGAITPLTNQLQARVEVSQCSGMLAPQLFLATHWMLRKGVDLDSCIDNFVVPSSDRQGVGV